MRKLFYFLSIISLVAIFSGLALASPQTGNVNRRLENQQDRINQGIRSGELTRREAIHLKEQDARIRANELYDKAHGGITPQEHRNLERQLNRTSRNIRRDKR